MPYINVYNLNVSQNSVLADGKTPKESWMYKNVGKTVKMDSLEKTTFR